jgi:hypothetical protein
MTEFLSAMIGALVGAFMVFVAESWRQVLAGKAAARFIYVESHHNALVCDNAAETGHFDGQLFDVAWRTYGIQVAPLLTMEASKLALIAYLPVLFSATSDDCKSRSTDYRTVAYWMHCIEQKGRFKILMELLKGQPTLLAEDKIKEGLATLS